MDEEGALYGTTVRGGGGLDECSEGCGTAFKLTPPTLGKNWRRRILYSFTGFEDAHEPVADVIAGPDGILYGTTIRGGPSKEGVAGVGTVFKLTPPEPGKARWKKAVLHTFLQAPYGDGWLPNGGLSADQDGALYGTTSGGWKSFYGTLFRLTPPAPGEKRWKLATIHSFEGDVDGVEPIGTLIIGEDGTLYGTTRQGGIADGGTAFKLAPPEPGKKRWKHTVLHRFGGDGDGYQPNAGLIADETGALYGTTQYGGAYNRGTVFKLTPPAPGQRKWTQVVLFSFGKDSGDPANPLGALMIGQDSALYGTTLRGGDSNNGTVFKLTH
jgi:uncharacterized repeat protein (TIGR03803 family)